MPDESTAQPAAPEGEPRTVTISLKDMAQRYLGAMQRTYDTAAVVVQGTREVNERGYEELIASSRFLPSREKHAKFESAKATAERWLLRNLISDAFGAVVPFLEDARTVCALGDWKKAGSEQAKLPAIFQEERQKFVRLDTPGKLAHLQSTYGLQFRLAEHLTGIESLAACLIRNDGTVAESAAPLSFSLISLDMVAGQTAADPKLQPQLGEAKKTFPAGATVTLEKIEYLNVLATIALFMNDAMRVLQERLSASELS